MSSFTTTASSQLARLTNPGTWLPASAWEDRAITVFVPSHYSIHIAAWPKVSLERVAALLPAPAEELVLTKQWENQTNVYYTNFTTQEARALAEALVAAGFEQGGTPPKTPTLSAAPGPDSTIFVVVAFPPVLPNQADQYVP